jgi:hypothetical protein
LPRLSLEDALAALLLQVGEDHFHDLPRVGWPDCRAR